MNRDSQTKHNQAIITKISLMLTYPYKRPSYRAVCRRLNESEFTSSVGNAWTERSIYRMLQRNGYSGLWGLQKYCHHN
ncbi:recombinase family protein [Thalassotalea castellviae]|uniref:recombinase family protein n=1 Tax=Thalassotalea castellviae TaxID=3075612 RepID=UPI003D771FCE